MHSDYTYTLELHRDDGSLLSQRAVEPEWNAALEWVHFEGIRAGRLAPTLAANLAEVAYRVAPLWDSVVGQPRVAAFRVAVPDVNGGEVARDVPITYLRDLVQLESAALVGEGKLERGDTYRYTVNAFAATSRREIPAGIEIEVEQAPQPLPLHTTSLEQFLIGAVDNDSDPGSGDFPVFIPASVLEETHELSRRAADVETGGVLVGFLHHDATVPEVFVEVTAQIPAIHTHAESAKLTFTRETWAAVRSALALRGRGETMAGWWHYHPDFCRLRLCPPENRVRCLASSAFFSSDDLALHAALFGRAFNTALLISDSTAKGLTTSLFGWRHGIVQSRGFYTTERNTADGPHDTNDRRRVFVSDEVDRRRPGGAIAGG